MQDYINTVIKKGDDASRDLSSLLKDTQPFSTERIKTIRHLNGSVSVLVPDRKYDLVSIPLAGDTQLTKPFDSAYEFVLQAKDKAKRIGVKPVAITNILDMSSIDNQQVIPEVKKGLLKGAQKAGVWVANGEIAGLGSRVGVPFNISGLLLCYAPRGKFTQGFHEVNNVPVIVSPHNNKLVYLNSDGVGTKLEWAERLVNVGYNVGRRILRDGQAMLWDDSIKLNADVIQDLRVLELNRLDGDFIRQVKLEARAIAQEEKVPLLVKPHLVANRISGYGTLNMNLSGTVVSLVDENKLANIYGAQNGDYVVGFYNQRNRNLRSNGITNQRELLVEAFGKDWHKKHIELLISISSPSTVFYHFFKKLLSQDKATQVGHFSGGAYDGKFAKVLGRQGLGANLHLNGHSFRDQEDLVLMQMNRRKTLQDICAQQPYRLEAWATTTNFYDVQRLADSFGYEAVLLGATQRMREPRLTITFDGKNTVSYSGNSN